MSFKSKLYSLLFLSLITFAMPKINSNIALNSAINCAAAYSLTTIFRKITKPSSKNVIYITAYSILSWAATKRGHSMELAGSIIGLLASYEQNDYNQDERAALIGTVGAGLWFIKAIID